VVKVEPIGAREDSKDRTLDIVQAKMDEFVIQSRKDGDLLICF